MRSAPIVLWAFLVTIETSSLFASGPALAQNGDKVTAEALFEEGRRLTSESKYAEACPKFADSERLDPSAATLLNLASCWEKIGRTATAWATYREAASLANASGRKDYVAVAQRHADALAPKLSRLTISAAEPAEGLLVRRDGVVVERAEWGTALPVDSGNHAVEATAPGRTGWTTTIDVAAGAPNPVALVIPALQAAPAESGATSSTSAASGGAAASNGGASGAGASSTEPASGQGNAQRTAALIVAGVGLVGVGVGVTFAVIAKNKDSGSFAHCDPVNSCDDTGLAMRSDAMSAGNAATVAVGLGIAGLVGGALLWLTSPTARPTVEKEPSARLVVVPMGAGALLKGVF